MSLIQSAKERERFFKFAIVGAIGFGVDFVTYNIVRSGIGFSPDVSSVVSFCTAVSSNFLFNRYWTYPDSRSKSVVKQVLQFSIVNVAGLIIRTTIFVLIHEGLVKFFEGVLVDFIIPARVIGENVSLAFVVIIVMFWNFFINRYWTYNDID